MARKVQDLSRREIREIALSYARSNDEVSRSYYIEQYNISESVFYHCLEKAVEESIVSLKEAELIANKAARNGARKAGKGASVNSHKHYQRFIDARSTFRFDSSDRKKYVEMYAKSPMEYKVFYSYHFIPEVVMRDAILVAVQSNEVSDECVALLYQKSLRAHGKEAADKLYDVLKAKREEFKAAKKQKERLQSKARRERKKAEKAAQAAQAAAEEEEAMREAQVAVKEEEARMAEQRTFVQMTLSDYSIPDELEEQKESLGIVDED